MSKLTREMRVGDRIELELSDGKKIVITRVKKPGNETYNPDINPRFRLNFELPEEVKVNHIKS